MKAIFYFTASIFFLFCKNENHLGKYTFHKDKYTESLELLDNNKFIYQSRGEFIKYEVNGSFYINNDSIFLNSSPQKDKIIVKEGKKGSASENTITVKDKYDNYIHYSLSIIVRDGSQIELSQQWKSSKLKNYDIKGFYITDAQGLKSPIYLKQGKFSNCFTVLFETTRVFDNESWFKNNEKIMPRGLNGKFQNYFLERK